jgi:hypothetical protein
MNEVPEIGQIWKRIGFSNYVVILDIKIDNNIQEQIICSEHFNYPILMVNYHKSTFLNYYTLFAKNFTMYTRLINIQYIIE